MSEPRGWYLYVVSCSDNTLYTGISTDLHRRLSEHNEGKGAAYTVSRGPVRLLAAWTFPDRSRATSAEHAMKRKTRKRKLALVEQGAAFQGGLPVNHEQLSKLTGNDVV